MSRDKMHGPNKLAHLSMIQGVINRMGGNLFFLKGWAVTLIVGLFAASISFGGKSYLQWILIGIMIFFWGFDAYFLSLERCYRHLYDTIRNKDEKEVDFSMDISGFRIYANNTWSGALFSKTLLAFYPLLGGAMIAIINFI